MEVTVVKECPLISREKGLELLSEYEWLRETGSLVRLSPLRESIPEALDKNEARVWLASKVASGKLTRQDQVKWLVSMFPKAPISYIKCAAGPDADPSSLSAGGVPWNRRKRRSVMRARAGEVLLHLFSGEQRWKGPGVVVEIEKSRGSDLMDEEIFGHVLCWGVKGVVGGVVGGPPCRSISRCRNGGDGGPAPVRDRGEGRLEGLPSHLQEMVKGDSVLCMRFLLAYAVAQAAADGRVDGYREVNVPGMEDTCSPSDHFRAFEEGVEVFKGPPEGTTDPVELAKWAMSEASARLQSKSRKSHLKGGAPSLSSTEAEGKEPPGGPASEAVKRLVRGESTVPGQKTFFVWEHPADPADYLPSSLAPPGGWPSWWSFPEWQDFASLYDLYHARFDQGKYGHVRPKP